MKLSEAEFQEELTELEAQKHIVSLQIEIRQRRLNEEKEALESKLNTLRLINENIIKLFNKRF